MRPTRDEWAMRLALETSKRTTCRRRAVGAVLLSKRGHVLATGYNGVAAGQPHCNKETTGVEFNLLRALYGANNPIPKFANACPGAEEPSGSELDKCYAIHAEQNALLQCRDVYDIETCYTTTSPCITCCKLLLNTGCTRIVYSEPYVNQEAKALWEASGREWVQLKL